MSRSIESACEGLPRRIHTVNRYVLPMLPETNPFQHNKLDRGYGNDSILIPTSTLENEPGNGGSQAGMVMSLQRVRYRRASLPGDLVKNHHAIPQRARYDGDLPDQRPTR